MAGAREIKSGMLSAESGVQEALRALYFYGADYIMLKMGRREKLIHKEQMISLMELGHDRTTIDEMSVMTLPEPVSAKTRAEDLPPDTALLMFSRKGGGPVGSLSMTSLGEYRERKINEAEDVYPEWWEAPMPLLYMDDNRVALNGAAAAKIPCEAGDLAARADKMKRDGVITVKDKKRELTFSIRPIEENVYMIEDISGDFEMAEELVWWAAVGKAFVRRVEENGAVVRRMSPLETPPASAADVLYCSWENEPLGSIAIGMPDDIDGDETPISDESGGDSLPPAPVSPSAAYVTKPDAPSTPEPRETDASGQTENSETGPAPEKPSRGGHARKTQTRPAENEKHERSAQRKQKDDLIPDSDAMPEPSKEKNGPVTKRPETSMPNAAREPAPFSKPSAKKGKAAGRVAVKKGRDEEKYTVSEPDLPPPAYMESAEEAGEDVKTGEPAAPKLLDKNAARRAYGGPRRKKAPGGRAENA
ncbi:MAG: hypothetical protein LBE65_05400 [Synergistaceae bacterium]|jgi:hypothetical protein|nr:hypothetical protein [Synergistaceae bacterium]